MTSSVQELAARCVVAVHAGRRFLGSGFLVAPGQVLTCAHVAAQAGAEPLTVRWAEGELPARQVRLMPDQAEPGRRTYGPPDLALITVDQPRGQPFAWLDGRGPEAGSDVLCLGFSEATTEAGAAADFVVLRVAAPGSGGLIRVQQGEIPLGMSGSLVLDLGTHRVCGVVKASRDTQAPRGGWIITVSAVAAHLGDVVEANMAGHGLASPWRQLATGHAKFASQLFGSPAPMQVPGPPGNAPPSWWLDPRHRATRFQERPELESLLAWATSQDPGTKVARLITAEGGAGKTRLAVELASRLAAAGWIAGILAADDVERLPRIAEALREVLPYGHRVFIALDYPEGMGEELATFLSRIPLPDAGDGGIVRVLLLARFGGDWWDMLHPAGRIKYLIDREPVQLTPLSSGPGAAAGLFGQALLDYRLKVLGPRPGGLAGDSPAVPPALAEAALQHAAAIKLHALALVSALHERDHGTLPDGEVAWADPLTTLVAHERRHWAEAARGRGLTADRSRKWASRILLVPTLLAVYRQEEATAAVSRIPGLDDSFPGETAETAALLRDLYPPDGSASLRWWSPLPLDRLGETLLAAVIGGLAEDEAVEYVTALLLAAGLPEAVQGLTVMTRLSADPGTASGVQAALARCLDALASAEGSRLLPALLVAGRQLPPGAPRPGERYLARLDPPAAMNLVQHLSQSSVPRLLQETGLALLDHAERALGADEARFKDVPGPVRELIAKMRDSGIDIPVGGVIDILAKALRAELLVRLGRAGEAVAPAEAAAREMRAVHRASSGNGPPDDYGLVVTGPAGGDYSALLLRVLGGYAEALHTVGRLTDAAEVRRECVTVARHAAGKGDPESEWTVVRCLCGLAEALLELGQAEQAESAARDAAERARSLPGLAQRAGALAVWAKTLDGAGRAGDARAVASDVSRILQQDAGLAVGRLDTARIIRALGGLAPAGAAAPDSLAELRRAAFGDPAAVLPALVYAALDRAERLAEQGDLEGGRGHMSEALGQARRLAADDPDTNLPLLAYLLVRGAELGLGADPVAEAAEAVGIYRRMVDRGRDDLGPELALALMEHASMLRGAGRDADALAVFAQAVELLRPLLARDRWRNTPYLCTALALFAETAVKHGEPGQAVAAAREAIDLEVSRTDDAAPIPARHLPQLRHILFLALARLLGETAGQGADPAALAAVTAEIGEIAGGLPAETLSDGDREIHAGALAILGTAQANAGHPEDAAPQFAEALRVLRGSDGAHPPEPDPLLFKAGRSLLSALTTSGRHPEAARAAAEILADCRRAQPLWEQERRECVLAVSHVIAKLPRPAHAAEALALAIALSRACREWLPRGDAARILSAVAILQLSRHLAEATAGGTAPDDWAAAALEVGAGAALLAGHPELFGTEHALAVAQAATALTAAGRLDDALELSARAVELHQVLAAGGQDPDPLSATASLYQQGVLLSTQGRPGDAVAPLERAVPVLLALGADIPHEHWMLLHGMVDLLRQAYRALGRRDAEQSLIDAVSESGIPLKMTISQPARRQGDDLRSALQAAQDQAAADPDGSVAALRELLLSPAGTAEYLTARAACGQVVTTLTKAGRFPEALRLCDLMTTSGRGVGLGDWARVDGKSRQLNVRLDAGLDPAAVLAEATALTARAIELTAEPGAADGPDVRWAREMLLRVSSRAALRLQRWPDALRFARAEADAMRERGVPPPEVAVAEFNSFTALLAMGRTTEAGDLLDRCEAAFRQDPEEQDLRLGLVAQARADLATRVGDPARAVALQSGALERLYQSGDLGQIQRAHGALGMRHAHADQHSPLALAHVLASAMLAELTGQPPDIQAVTVALVRRAGEHPATAAAVCAAMEEPAGRQFARLLENLARAPAAPGPDKLVNSLIRQARGSQPALFRELAAHRMRWDPVFAAIAAARQGSLPAATAVRDTLSDYAGNADWSQLCRALGHVLSQRPEAVSAAALDDIDAILLRRCADALDGNVIIPAELAYGMPLNDVLTEVLVSAQKGQTSPLLARTLESLAGAQPRRPLVSALQRILAGERGLSVASGLDPASVVIVTTLLGHLTAP